MFKFFAFFILIFNHFYGSESRLYVNLFNENQVAVVDLSTNSLINKVSLPGGSFDGIAVMPNGKKVYNTCQNTRLVCQFDTTTFAVKTILTNIQSFGIVISSRGLAYISDFERNQIIVLNTLNDEVIHTIRSNQFNGPGDLYLSSDESVLYVANFNGRTISQIDTITNQAIAPPLPTIARPYEIAVTPNQKKGYVTTTESFEIGCVDFLTNTTTILPVSGFCYDPTVSPDGKTVYVGQYTTSSLLLFIDTATNLITTRLPIPEGSGYTAIKRDGLTLYVAAPRGPEGIVSIVDTVKRAIIGEISLDTFESQIGAMVIYEPNPLLDFSKAAKYIPIKYQRGVLPE